jgi:hypothetical protein
MSTLRLLEGVFGTTIRSRYRVAQRKAAGSARVPQEFVAILRVLRIRRAKVSNIAGLMTSFLKRGTNISLGPVTMCLAVLPILLCGITLPASRQTHGNVNDFVEYWTAAHQVFHGNDPYAAGPTLALERQVGFAQSNPLIMRNPPWIVPVIAVFGLLPFAAAQNLWLGCGLISLLISARWLWGLYQEKGQSPWTSLVATALFLPVTVALAIGQISPLVLLGVAGFLHFEKQGKLGWAGGFLFLVAQKPHLIFLLWVALLLWSIRMSVGRTLAALTSITVAASLVAVALDHSIFAQYFSLFTRDRVLLELTPTASGLLRLSLPQYPLVQLLPALLAFIWFCFYWRSSRDRWQWREEMPVLLLVSLLTTPYGWFFDQVVLLPCAFQVVAWLMTSRRLVSTRVAGLYLAANAAALALILGHRTTFWYVWTVPAWLALYMFSRAKRRNQRVAPD